MDLIVTRSRYAGFASLLAVVAILFPSAVASGSSGSVFYGGWYDYEIGSIGFDGSNPRPNLIVNNETIPSAMMVNDGFLYWQSNSSPIRIGRSRLDGSEVVPSFIRGGHGSVNAEGLSVNDGRIYWSETRNSTGFGSSFLSSANLIGADRRLRTLSLGRNTGGPVVVRGRWAFFLIEKNVRGIQRYWIARRRLDHKGSRRVVAANRPFVGSSLAAKGSHIYWLEQGRRQNIFIARASLNAASINTRFRRVPRKGCHVRSSVVGAALSSRFFFLGCSSGEIDRVSLRGRPHLRKLATGAKLSSGPVLAATP